MLRKRFTALVLAGFGGVAAWSVPGTPVAAASTIVCAFSGAGTVDPPVTYKNAQQESYQFQGTVQCSGTPSGGATATGTGTFTCLSGSSVADITLPSGDIVELNITHHLNTFGGQGSVLTNPNNPTPNAGAAARGEFVFYGTGALGCAGTGVTAASVNGLIQL